MTGKPDERERAQNALQKLLFARIRPPAPLHLEVKAPDPDQGVQESQPLAAGQDELVRVKVALQKLGIGRTKLYDLIAQGELEAVKMGKATMLTTESIEALRRRLPKWKPKRKGLGEDA